MPTLNQLLSLPEIAGGVSPERRQQIKRVLTEDRKSDMPWYMRFLVAVGAWLACAFFIGFFLAIIGWDDNHRTGFGVTGLVMLAASIFVVRLNLGLFASQCCLAVSMAGQFMIYYGFLPESHHTVGSAVVFSIVLAVALYGLYPDLLQRLVTCVAALQITLAWIYLGSNGEGLETGVSATHDAVCLAAVYWMLHLAGLAYCWIWVSRRSATLVPLGYALVVSLVAWQLENLFNLWAPNGLIVSGTVLKVLILWPYYLRLAFTALMFFGVVVWAAGGLEACRRYPLPFVSLASVIAVIIWFGAGGVLLPLLLITLGFFIERGVVLGIGLVLLPVFLSTYYYNLHLDLLAKSVALAGTGLALLLLRAGLRRWWSAEPGEVA